MNTAECRYVLHYNAQQLRSWEHKSILGHVPGHLHFSQLADPLPAE